MLRQQAVRCEVTLAATAECLLGLKLVWALLAGSKGCPRHCAPSEHAHEGFVHRLLPLPTLRPV